MVRRLVILSFASFDRRDPWCHHSNGLPSLAELCTVLITQKAIF